jgi:predicted dehydrogenase
MVNVAVVGVGWCGQTLVRLIRQSDELRVVGLVDPDPQAASFARSTGLPLLAAYEATLADPLVDAVVLCTPHSLHCRQTSPQPMQANTFSARSPFASHVMK